MPSRGGALGRRRLLLDQYVDCSGLTAPLRRIFTDGVSSAAKEYSREALQSPPSAAHWPRTSC